MIVINRNIEKRYAELLTNSHPSCPVIYFKIKTHKLDPEKLKEEDPTIMKVRPVISSCDGPTDCVSWLLTKIIAPVLEHVPSHLKNTGELLNALRNLNVDDKFKFESFDIESLYTNIDQKLATEWLVKMVYDNNIKLYGLKINDINYLINVILKSSFFKFNGVLYKQKRGLAMGNRIAPLLAIAYMNKIEAGSTDRDIILYKRYIDDILIIGRN